MAMPCTSKSCACTPLTSSADCSIAKNTHLAELIKRASLIAWHEAPMAEKLIAESVSSTLRDVMTDVDPALENVHFGGIPVVFGGDFRQVLPVIKHGGRATIVEAMLKKSLILWPQSSSSS